MRVLVAGAGGLVGRAVSEHCAALGDTVLPHDHHSLDITDPVLVRETLKREQPEVVINCAAWTDVDGCERDEKRAFAANAGGPENLARDSGKANAAFITISTDYVFDGTKDGFYTQNDEPNPASVYAASKLEGERRSEAVNPASIVVRTGYVFGPGGNNFLSTIFERARRGEKLKAITDAHGTPTYAKDLAARLRELAVLNVGGIYHAVNNGPGVSFEEFARAALELAGLGEVKIEGVSMDSLHRPAKRPRNSRLRCLRSGAIGLPPLRYWKNALEDFAELSLRDA